MIYDTFFLSQQLTNKQNKTKQAKQKDHYDSLLLRAHGILLLANKNRIPEEHTCLSAAINKRSPAESSVLHSAFCNVTFSYDAEGSNQLTSFSELALILLK